MPTKRELAEQVAKLEKLLKDRDELLMQSAIKFEELHGSMNTLTDTKSRLIAEREKLQRTRYRRKK